MSVSILVVDDQTDVAALFRRETRQGSQVLQSAYSAEDTLKSSRTASTLS
jgi:hypothetical protein